MKYKRSLPIITLVIIACITLSAYPVQAFTNPELLQAVRESDHIRVSQLLNNGTDVNYCTQLSSYALLYCHDDIMCNGYSNPLY